MNCVNCGQPNRDGAAFCGNCGTRLEPAPAIPAASDATNPVTPAPREPGAASSGQICPNCQQQNRIGAKRCRRCSEPLTSTRRCPHCNAENRVPARYCRVCSRSLMANALPRLGTGNLAPSMLVMDRYQIIHKIAQGGMGAVYLVKDARLSDSVRGRDKFWALKEMSESAFPPDQLEYAKSMFQNEATMLAQLRHPNLPLVIDFFEFQSKNYLVMDFVKGETLEAVLKKNNGPLGVDTVLKWSNQLCGVLQYLHDQNPPILYRDLKPSNIMLENETSLLKIIDFGIARFQRKKTSKNLLLPGLSQDDAGIGTMGYAPPEQWRKGDVTVQADVYSLGVVLHQLLTNYDPTTTPFCLPSIPSLNPAVPARIAEVIARAYEPNLNQRFQTVTDFHRALSQAWLDSFGGWSTSGGAVPPGAPGQGPVT